MELYVTSPFIFIAFLVSHNLRLRLQITSYEEKMSVA